MKERASRHQGVLEVADIHQFALVKIITKAYSINLNSSGICGLTPKILYICSEKCCRNTLVQEILDRQNYSNLYLYSTTTINQPYISGVKECYCLWFFYTAYYHSALCCSTSLSSKLYSIIFTLLPINGCFVDAQENSFSEHKLQLLYEKYSYQHLEILYLHLFMQVYA